MEKKSLWYEMLTKLKWSDLTEKEKINFEDHVVRVMLAGAQVLKDRAWDKLNDKLIWERYEVKRLIEDIYQDM